MRLVACDATMGLPRIPPRGYRPDQEDLLSEMRRLGIERAIVRHRAAYECGPIAGNRAILEETRGREELLATWFVTPDGFEPDFDPEKAIEQMVEAGVRVAWTNPQAEGFSLLPWCSGPLYEVLEARRVPLLLSYANTTADVLDVVLGNFPRLRLILLDAPRLGRSRLLYPLLRRHPNLWLCLSQSYSVHQGFEDLCRTFGQERWVFGTGYPEAEGGAAIAGLAYAELSEEAKEAIGHGNIERLLEEVSG